MKTSLSLLAALFVLAPGLAVAQSQQPQPNMRSACEADVQKLCAGVQPGSRRIANCLKANQAKVSQPCKDAIAARNKPSKAPDATQGNKAPS